VVATDHPASENLPASGMMLCFLFEEHPLHAHTHKHPGVAQWVRTNTTRDPDNLRYAWTGLWWIEVKKTVCCWWWLIRHHV